MEQLSSKIFPKKERKVKVLQFGEGNFLRAFVDWIINTMNNKGVFDGSVCVVQPMEFGRVDDLAKQDGLYTLFLQGLQDGKIVREHEVISCLDDFINPFRDYDKYLAYAKSEDLEFIISNTTEAGIALDESDVDFTKTPKSFPGKLLSLLEARFNHFNGDMSKGLDIIPCELIDYNGDTLKEILVKLADIRNMSDEFKNWLVNANRYYNTLVDRIVPGYPRNEAQQLQEELGYEDNSMVVGEVFHLWVIDGEHRHQLEQRFNAPKAGLNVLFVDSIKPYKERKVKILNGSHTCLVPVSYLAGIDTVRETMEDAQLKKFVNEFIFNEVVPTIAIPQDQMVSFANSVLERYANPFVRHELMSIALNSITKYKTRILPSVLTDLENNNFPSHALFSLAALMAFYRGKRGVEDIKLSDNKEFLDLFADLWARHDKNEASTKDIVTEFLGLEIHWEVNLNKFDNVTTFVTECLDEILAKGMRAALAKVGC